MAAERTDARIYCWLPFERVPVEVDRKLHGSLIFLELISDVFLYLLSVFPNRVDVVPPAPEFSVPALDIRVKIIFTILDEITFTNFPDLILLSFTVFFFIYMNP